MELLLLNKITTRCNRAVARHMKKIILKLSLGDDKPEETRDWKSLE